MNDTTHLGIYKNSIHIEITPDDVVLYNYDDTNIPSPFNISFCDVTDIIDLFNSPRGFKILKMGMDGNLKLNLFPTDSVGITEYEKNFLVGHESLFRKPNINLYQTWYDFDLSFNHYIGSTIHDALAYFINYFRNTTFDKTKKEKTFLTLNNLETPDRLELYNLYQSLENNDKEKFVCSFIFKDIYLDKGARDQLKQYKKFFGTNIIDFYQNSLIEIVSESSGIATTEKTFKPLLAGIPFIHNLNNLNGIIYPIEFLKQIGIDTSYFDIDYSNRDNIYKKITELLNMTPEVILDVYKKDFEKAKENKIKFYNFIDKITNELILK